MHSRTSAVDLRYLNSNTVYWYVGRLSIKVDHSNMDQNQSFHIPARLCEQKSENHPFPFLSFLNSNGVMIFGTRTGRTKHTALILLFSTIKLLSNTLAKIRLKDESRVDYTYDYIVGVQRTMRASLGPLRLFRGFTNLYMYVVPTRVLRGAGVPSFTPTCTFRPCFPFSIP